MARILLQQEGVLVNATNDIGESALHWCHSADTVRLLVEHGADLEQCDKSGHTPLMKACSRVADKNPCRADVIFALLEAGANIQAGLTANAVSVCWDNLGNDIVERLLQRWGYDLYSPSSSCSPLPWVNLSRSCGDATVVNLLSDLPHWGLRGLCSNVIVARDWAGNKDLKVYVRQFTKMQADTNDAELYRQARLLDYVSPMIVQAQVALTRCKLWLILAQSLPKACKPTTVTELIRNKEGAWAEDCLDMSLDALEALLAPLKREAVALGKLAAENEGRGESCTYAGAIGSLIDSIRGEAKDITHIATGAVTMLFVDGGDEDVATRPEDAAIIATLTALGPDDDWARVIGGLQRVFQTIDPDETHTTDLVRLVNRLLATCCKDFTNHPDFHRFKIDDKKDKVQEATTRIRAARKFVVETNREADEDAKRKFPIRGGERKQKQLKMNMQRQEYIKKIRDKCQRSFEKEESSIKLEKHIQKYQATLEQLPDLWEHCATQIVDQQKGNGRPIYNTVDLDRMDPSKPGGCGALGDAINTFSSLISSCAHRHATAIGQIYVNSSAHMVDESGRREEEQVSGVLEQPTAGGGEEKGTDGSEVQNDEGAGKKGKGNKTKNTAESDAAEGKSSESIVGGKSTSPQTVKRSEKQKREAREAAEQLAREKSRLERQKKRDREAVERKALEAQWAAEQEVKLKAEQEAKDADPAIAEMCRILKHAIDFSGPGRLELLAEAETALGKSGVKDKVATTLLMEAMLAFVAETKRCKVVVETRRADVERRRIVVGAKQRRNEEAAQRRKVEERANLLKAEQAALRAEEAALHKEEEALRKDEKKAQLRRVVEERTRVVHKAEEAQVQEERRRGGEAQVRKYDEEEARRRKAENDQRCEEKQTDRPQVLEWKTVSASTTLRRVQRTTMLSNHCAGTVIGRRGANIKQIRLDSGASVIIVDPTTVGGPRTVTVIGSSGQCQVAEQMIEQIVDEDLRESGRQSSQIEQRQLNETLATKRKLQVAKDKQVEEEQEAARETTRLAHEKSRLEQEQKREQDAAEIRALEEQLAAEQEATLKAKREKEAEEEEEKEKEEQRRKAEDEAENAQRRKDADDAQWSTAEDDAQGRKEADDARRRVEEEAQKLMREAQKLMEDEFDSSEDEEDSSTADSNYLNSPRGDETETKNSGETQLTAQVETRGGAHSEPTTSVACVSRDTVGAAGATGAAGVSCPACFPAVCGNGCVGGVGENSLRDDISDGRVSQGFAGPSVSDVCDILRHAIDSRGPDQVHHLLEAATIALQKLTNTLPTFPATMALAGASTDHSALKLRILYIDDSVAACTMACTVFARLGFVADVRVGGVKGLDCVCDDNSIPPDMVVLDLDMPHINGYSLLKVIKENPRWKSVPVFITTSTNPSDPHKEELRQLGAFAVEAKPVQQSMLRLIVQQTVTSAAAAGRVHRKLRLLFVDDSDAVCNAACALFEPLGFVIEAIRGGIEGLEYICNEDTVLPHVVILDLDMPHVNGRSLLRVIKDNKKWQHVAVLILTGTTPTREYQMELLEIGAHSLMMKPISAEKIVQVVMKGVEGADKEEAEEAEEAEERGRAGVGGVEGAVVGAKGGGGSGEGESGGVMGTAAHVQP